MIGKLTQHLLDKILLRFDLLDLGFNRRAHISGYDHEIQLLRTHLYIILQL